MIKPFENRAKLIEKYKDAVAYVAENNGGVDTFVAYEMLCAAVLRGGKYAIPEGFDQEQFRKDYEELMGEWS